MTTVQRQNPTVGHYRFANVAAMEWVKLRSLRSTWLTLAVTVVGAVGIALNVGLTTDNASGDPTGDVLAGIAPGLLLTGVLGVMMMTSEYSSGMIRLTLAAAPNRRMLLAAKAAVFAAVAMVVGEVAAFLSFFVGRAALPDSIPAPDLGQPGVLRALVLAGAGYCLIGLIGLGLGAVIRHTPAAIGVLVAGVYLGAQLLFALAESAMGYAPIAIVANSLSSANPVPDMLGPWTGLGVLCLYAAVALGIGGLLLERRDA